MADMALGETSQYLLGLPTPAFSPFAPAGITDLMRTGWLGQLGGMFGQLGAAGDIAGRYGDYADMATNYTRGLLGTRDRGGYNPLRYGRGAYGRGRGGGGRMGDLYGQGAALLRGALDPTQFNLAQSMTQEALAQSTPGQLAAIGAIPGAVDPAVAAMRHAGGMGLGAYGRAAPGLLGAAGLTGAAMQRFGGGFSPEIAAQINQIGASFDPFDNPALADAVSQANRQLGREFNQSVMPALNRGAVAAGPGAYGGTRAGIAQGLREQSLADAMGRTTTDMLSRGYETGLQRYVQDRANTIANTIAAGELGSRVGLGGAAQMGDIFGRLGQLGLGAAGQYGQLAQGAGQLGLAGAGQMADIYNRLGAQNLAQAAAVGNLAQAFGQLGLGAGSQFMGAGNVQRQAAATEAAAQTAANARIQAAQLQAQTAADQLRAQQQQFALGSLMPGIFQGMANFGMMPGRIQAGIGQTMAGMGGQQQAANQAQINWMNQLANQTTQYPNQMFGMYNQWMNPITSPLGSMVTTPGGNPWQMGLGGAMTGYGLWNNLFNQNPHASAFRL